MSDPARPRPPDAPPSASRPVSPLAPTASVLVKLGSIARHVEEATGPDAHPFDVAALRSLLDDPEVIEWMASADALALLPLKRQ